MSQPGTPSGTPPAARGERAATNGLVSAPPAGLEPAAYRWETLTDRPVRRPGADGKAAARSSPVRGKSPRRTRWPHHGRDQRHHTRGIDERQSAGLNSDGDRARPEHFADSTPERLDAGHIEVTDKDDGGFGAVALRLDVQDVAWQGLRFIRLGDPPGLSPITTWVGS